MNSPYKYDLTKFFWIDPKIDLPARKMCVLAKIKSCYGGYFYECAIRYGSDGKDYDRGTHWHFSRHDTDEESKEKELNMISWSYIPD